MKIIISLSPLHSRYKTRGISIYTRNLVENLKKVDQHNQYIVTSKTSQISSADLIHYPYFDFYFHTLPLIRKTKTIVTIHDVIPLIFPAQFPAGIQGRFKFQLQKLALKSVNAVIAVSKNSQKDTLKFFPFLQDKVFSIYSAASQSFSPFKTSTFPRLVKKYRLPQDFFLYVGDLNYNKNLPTLIEAFAQFTAKQPSFHLVLVGRSFADKKLKEAQELLALINQKELGSKIRLLTRVPLDPTNDLAKIYHLSTAYIQPSYYEGFGLPVLEAMSCAKPIIIANTASLPEVGGSVALYFDPHSSPQLVEQMNQIVKLKQLQPKQYLKLSQASLAQSKKFSWEKTAKETIGVYRKILSERK